MGIGSKLVKIIDMKSACCASNRCHRVTRQGRRTYCRVLSYIGVRLDVRNYFAKPTGVTMLFCWTTAGNRSPMTAPAGADAGCRSGAAQ